MAWTAAEQAEIAAADAEIERGWSGASARERALSLWLDRQAAAGRGDHRTAANRARQAAYRAAHKEEVAAYQAAYYAAHKEEINARRRARRKEARHD